MEELIKARDKLISNNVLAPELSKTKLVGVEESGDLNPKIFKTFASDNVKRRLEEINHRVPKRSNGNNISKDRIQGVKLHNHGQELFKKDS